MLRLAKPNLIKPSFRRLRAEEADATQQERRAREAHEMHEDQWRARAREGSGLGLPEQPPIVPEPLAVPHSFSPAFSPTGPLEAPLPASIGRESTVADLVAACAAATGVDARCVKLLFKGDLTKDAAKKLAETPLKPGARVLLMKTKPR